MKTIIPVHLNEDQNKLILLDQTLLPCEKKFIETNEIKTIWMAIKKLQVRGAPAIGIAAAFGIYVAMLKFGATTNLEFYEKFLEYKKYLNESRPTAVNLSWALNRMHKRVRLEKNKNVDELEAALLEESQNILTDDQAMGKAIGKYGLSLLDPNMGIMTHCNAGGIATSGYGTALAPIYKGEEKGYNFKVFSGETRPLLQGSRLTAWELDQAKIDVTVITDNMASIVMKQGKIDAVLVGCDRIAANGDTANKIGTSGIAILAKEYKIPMYILGPTSTIDMQSLSGEDIEIELRDPSEIGFGFGKRTAPESVKAYNPAFDVTDAKYITAIITEKGITYPPYKENLKKLFTTKS